MDKESQIVAQLAAALPKERPAPVEDGANNAPLVQEGDPDVLKDPEVKLEWTVAKNELLDFFDIQGWSRSNPQVDQQLSTILEWASAESESQSMAEILRVINDQMTIMGIRHKEERIRRLWQFVKIRQQRQLLDQRERVLYG